MDEIVRPTKITSRKSLGEILVGSGQLTHEQLEEALKLQQKQRRKLGETLARMGLVSPQRIAAALSVQLNIPLIDLKRYVIQPRALQQIPERLARKYNLIPVDIAADTLVVVMADPGDIRAIEDITAQVKMVIQPAVGIPDDIREAIDLSYKAQSEIQEQVEQFTQTGKTPEITEPRAPEEAVAQTPVVRTVDLLVMQALKSRASDIHIEPQKTRVRVRYRIDGVLHDAMSLPLDTIEMLVSRIKILAGMDITERRRPQDGQFSFKADGREADIRAATFETEHGETVVLRILDKALPLFTLPQLGFSPDALKKYQEMLNSPYGMILVAGPTGSGKTTTLYASLNQLNRNEQNIVTIEEPIEYHFADIKQSQINPKAGITFASGLRSIMRLDPDVILVGEIRDADTANIAVQAALTGHLVLSSIHANDAIGVLFRLMNLGVEPYLICSALIAVVAQRIVRRVCHHCRELYVPTAEERLACEKELGTDKVDFYHGAGCNLCAGTGYLMRTAIFEVLPMSDGIRRLLLQNASVDDIKAQAVKEGMISLRRAGMLKVREEATTIQEILRNSFSISG